MTDTPHDRGPQDRARINLKDELHYWTEALDASPDELRKVVHKVGTIADAVRKELAK